MLWLPEVEGSILGFTSETCKMVPVNSIACPQVINGQCLPILSYRHGRWCFKERRVESNTYKLTKYMYYYRRITILSAIYIYICDDAISFMWIRSKRSIKIYRPLYICTSLDLLSTLYWSIINTYDPKRHMTSLKYVKLTVSEVEGYLAVSIVYVKHSFVWKYSAFVSV